MYYPKRMICKGDESFQYNMKTEEYLRPGNN